MQFKNIVFLLFGLLLAACTSTQKQVEKQPDNRISIDGGWLLASINDAPINRSIILPNLEIDVKKMQISGSGGCNSYSGAIKKLDLKTIDLGDILSTLMACSNKNIESDYLNALNKTKTYAVENGLLVFYDANGKKTLSFLKNEKQEKKEANKRLHDIWVVERINGNSIKKEGKLPRIEIFLKDMKVLGTDGCNNYSGGIKEVSDTVLKFQSLASTKMMCREMKITNEFNNAMSQVTSYRLDGLKLILMNSEGKEILAFFKVD
jgi:heat shock protein HslJ